MKRGDIFSAATGSGLGSKPRPVIILNSNHFIDLPTVMVAPLTSDHDETMRLRPVIEPSATNNLEKSSAAMIDLLIAVPLRKFGRRIGALSTDDLVRVERELMVLLGLTR